MPDCSLSPKSEIVRSDRECGVPLVHCWVQMVLSSAGKVRFCARVAFAADIVCVSGWEQLLDLFFGMKPSIWREVCAVYEFSMAYVTAAYLHRRGLSAASFDAHVSWIAR